MAMTRQKRRAEDDLDHDQRFAKRFDLLNLDHNGKLYLPVQNPPSRTTPRLDQHDNESMHVDDTNDRVYIRNLDEELADIESEEKLIFLPDIDKKLNEVPRSVLLGENYPSYPSAGNELVLYGVPASLSIPKERDKVRKAIIESRARAQEKQVLNDEANHVDGEKHRHVEETLADLPSHTKNQVKNAERDEDVMDLG